MAKSGFTDRYGKSVKEGDTVWYPYAQRQGVISDILQDGDAQLSYNDETVETVKWINTYLIHSGTPPKYDYQSTKQDAINRPSHYTAGSVETIDCIESCITGYDDPKEAFAAGQVIRYIARAPFKGAKKEDLDKAQQYLNRLRTGAW